MPFLFINQSHTFDLFVLSFLCKGVNRTGFCIGSAICQINKKRRSLRQFDLKDCRCKVSLKEKLYESDQYDQLW